MLTNVFLVMYVISLLYSGSFVRKLRLSVWAPSKPIQRVVCVIMKCFISWEITSCSPLIDSEDWGYVSVRNVGWFPTVYTTVYSRRHNSVDETCKHDPFCLLYCFFLVRHYLRRSELFAPATLPYVKELPPSTHRIGCWVRLGDGLSVWQRDRPSIFAWNRILVAQPLAIHFTIRAHDHRRSVNLRVFKELYACIEEASHG